MDKTSLQNSLKLYNDNKYNEAVPIILTFAKKGNVKAQYVLGEAYLLGNGVNSDLNKAKVWFKRSAIKNNAEANYYLGVIYDPSLELVHFKNRRRDKELSHVYYKKAVALFRKDAKKGDEKAMRWLGICYQCEKGVKQDQEKMLFWFRKAFENGCNFVANDLFSYYSNEKSPAYDKEEALKYYKNIKETGNQVVYNEKYELLTRSKFGKKRGVRSLQHDK